MSGEGGRVSRNSVGQQVRPERVVEKSFVESVAGFINEVAPQTYSGPSSFEGKERITWVSFDTCDINDLSQFKDRIEVNGNSPPLLLTIGYATGVQVWVIPVTGDAVEVLSWRQGAVRSLKILPTPIPSEKILDIYSLKRPLMALCDSAAPGTQFCSVSFISLKTAEQVKTIKFKSAIHDICANKSNIVVSFPEKLAIFDAATLEDIFTITTCYACPGPNLNPIALGDRWLAYADRRLVSVHQSAGGVAEGTPSYKATVFHAAKSLTKGLKELGESVVSNVMGQQRHGATQVPPPVAPSGTNHAMPGIVTIVDTQLVSNGDFNVSSLNASSGVCVVAHFVAHVASPIVALSFDATGMLLLTADKQGHSFNLFRIQPHAAGSVQAAVHHLYTLYRGDTTAKVTDISFSLDSRWVAVSTHRGTTHVFPVTPYGGNIGVRTHMSKCVVNRLSRFQRSAGLDETPSSGRNSPVLSASPAGSSKLPFEPSLTQAYPNPRQPPYPVPVLVKPLVQLRQPLLQNLLESITSSPSPSRSSPVTKSPRSPSGEDPIKVVSVFGSARGWLAGSPTVPREKQGRAVDALFVMAYHGNLIEYHLEPSTSPLIPQDKVTDESHIELDVHANAQWLLARESTNGEVRPPLDAKSPLLEVTKRSHSMSPGLSLEHDDPEERWMAQVEIHTYAGPHRRLWMGPQFSFRPVSVTSTGDCSTHTLTLSDMMPPRSSPVNIGVGSSHVPVLIESSSLSGSHEQSPRLPEGYHECQELTIDQLTTDLADAMLDTHAGAGQVGAGESSHNAECSSGMDMTDVMDISCDPPGPVPSPCRPQQVSPHFSLTSSPVFLSGETPRVNPRLSIPLCDVSTVYRSSMPESRTSSVEELSMVLSSANIDETAVKFPVVKPPKLVGDAEFVEIDLPDEERSNTWHERSTQMSYSSACGRDKVTSVSTVPQLKNEWPTLGRPSEGASTATNSEDDLWPSVPTDTKRDRKKKKKPQRPSSDLEQSSSDLSPCLGIVETMTDSCFGMEVETFHPANCELQDAECHQVETDCFHEAVESVLEDFELRDDSPKEAEGGEDQLMVGGMLRSMHDENDLARALEEAYSSDDPEPVAPPTPEPRGGSQTRSRCCQSEMFPFKTSSSDDDDEFRIRRRLVPLLLTPPSKGMDPPSVFVVEDRGETSGEERGSDLGAPPDWRGTSGESDPGTSSGSCSTSVTKNRKKKKKKR